MTPFASSRWTRPIGGLALALLGSTMLAAQTNVLFFWPSGRSQVRFEIRVPRSVRGEKLTGRVYVILAHDETREPRLQVGRVGAPLFGRDVEQLAPGAAAIVDGHDLGTPIADMADLPAGDYWVQPFVNVYSEFKRADGHVLWMHDDRWEGQNWLRSPGNIYGTPQRVHFDPRSAQVVALTADKVIPPIEPIPDDDFVQRFKIQSPTLAKFWGRPIYLGATVLLPRGYKTSTISYPVNYIQGHFGLNAPYGFSAAAGGRGGRGAGTPSFRDAWMTDTFPRVIAVTFQHPTPYFDDSYAVNSVNVGPYGDAIMQELILEIEKRYRVIREPWARWLTGGSTGGWEALALQIFHPDFFGGTWASCPDRVTFTDVEGVNIYKDDNAFYKSIGDFHRTPTVNSREVNGEIRQTAQQRTGWSRSTARTADPAPGSRTSGRRSSARSAAMATSSRSSIHAPAPSTSPSRSTGRNTTTSFTTCNATGRRLVRSSWTSCTVFGVLVTKKHGPFVLRREYRDMFLFLVDGNRDLDDPTDASHAGLFRGFISGTATSVPPPSPWMCSCSAPCAATTSSGASSTSSASGADTWVRRFRMRGRPRSRAFAAPWTQTSRTIASCSCGPRPRSSGRPVTQSLMRPFSDSNCRRSRPQRCTRWRKRSRRIPARSGVTCKGSRV
jgi:hypothetical protein